MVYILNGGITNELNSLILFVLVSLFMYSIWQIDISFGAILTGSKVITASGYEDPMNWYHKHLSSSIYIMLAIIAFFLLNMHYRDWKADKEY